MQQRGNLSIAWKRGDRWQLDLGQMIKRCWINEALQLHSPSVVLSIEQEVCANNGDTNRHDAEDDQNQHHKTVHIVNFVGPKGGEDKVPETQKPTWSHLQPTPPNYTRVKVRWHWMQVGTCLQEIWEHRICFIGIRRQTIDDAVKSEYKWQLLKKAQLSGTGIIRMRAGEICITVNFTSIPQLVSLIPTQFASPSLNSRLAHLHWLCM